MKILILPLHGGSVAKKTQNHRVENSVPSEEQPAPCLGNPKPAKPKLATPNHFQP